VTGEHFATLVRRAERLAARNPAAYRVRVVILGALGYLYVWLLLLAAVGALALVVLAVVGGEGGRVPARVAREAAIPIMIFAGVVARALWVKLDAPEGKLLDPADFPQLFEAIDGVRRAVKGPKLRAVLLDDRFNASITQVPRLGVLGWHRNYLMLGLPLLQLLSARQFLAVLAHEYGHLSGAHGKLGTWIYRIRSTWMSLLAAFHERQLAGAGLVRRFFEWYAPYFSAYSFALARAHEYEADRCAATVAGASHIGAALVRLETAAAYLNDEYWPGMYRNADSVPRPEGQPFGRLTKRASSALSPERARPLLEGALAMPTDLTDTHPSLSDRLRSLGLDPELPELEAESAAEAFLGDHLRGIVTEFDLRWRAAVTPSWRGRYEHVQAARGRLRELYDGPDADRTPDDLLERARLVDELAGREQALPLYRRALERNPEAPLALCIVGLSLLEQGDESGLDMVERAMAGDADVVISACRALRDHFAAAGDMQRASAYHERAMGRAEERERVLSERSDMPFSDVYEPHDLPDDVVRHVTVRLRADSFVRHALLVKKRLDPSSEPVYVVGVLGGLRFSLGGDRRAIAERLAGAIDVDQEIYFVVLEGPNKALIPILAKVPGSELF